MLENPLLTRHLFSDSASRDNDIDDLNDAIKDEDELDDKNLVPNFVLPGKNPTIPFNSRGF